MLCSSSHLHILIQNATINWASVSMIEFERIYYGVKLMCCGGGCDLTACFFLLFFKTEKKKINIIIINIYVALDSLKERESRKKAAQSFQTITEYHNFNTINIHEYQNLKE